MFLTLPLLYFLSSSGPIPCPNDDKKEAQVAHGIECPNSAKALVPSEVLSKAEEHNPQTPQNKSRISSALSAIGGFFCRLIYDPINVITTVIAFFTIGLYLIGRDTARKELRAYVSADTKEVVGSDGKPVANSIGVEMRNAGQTPARRLTHWMYIEVRNFPLSKDLEPPEEDRLRVYSVLHPGMTRMIIGDFPVKDVENAKTRIENGSMALYIWGEITYDDVFGEERTTKFRFWLGKEGMRLHRFAHYATGNEAT